MIEQFRLCHFRAKVHNGVAFNAEGGADHRLSVRLHDQRVSEPFFEPVPLVRAPFSPNHPVVLPPELYESLGTDNAVFRWGWSYTWHSGFVPESESWVEDEGVFIVQPYVQRHICHFAESVGQVLMKLMDRSLYPALRQLYLPTFRRAREYEWSKAYLQLIRELFPPEHRFSLRFYNDSSTEMECFRSSVEKGTSDDR